jgi:hypothetical protein
MIIYSSIPTYIFRLYSWIWAGNRWIYGTVQFDFDRRHIFIDDMAYICQLRRVWKLPTPFFSFSHCPHQVIFSHGRRLLVAHTAASWPLAHIVASSPGHHLLLGQPPGAAPPSARPLPPDCRSPATIARPPEGHHRPASVAQPPEGSHPATTTRLPPCGHQCPEGHHLRPSHRCRSTSTSPQTLTRFQSSQIL